MRKVAFWAIALFYLLFVSAVSTDASRGIKITQIDELSHHSGKLGEYKALIIGINDYQDPKVPNLETATNDANAIGRVLKDKYGFKVDFLLDRKATREVIYKQLRNLAASSKPDDSVLIYFAGHGDLDQTYNDGWWIPSDAAGGNPATYLSNVQVQIAIRSMKARHVLLISDSCYSGMLFGKARNLPHVINDKYYLGLYNEKSRWGLTSGNKEPVSDAGSEGHSVFAYQLLKELKQNDKPFTSIQEIYTRIAPIISNNSEQTPLCRPIQNTGDQGGEFVFVAALQEDPHVTVYKSLKGIWEMELAFWQSIQNSDDPDEYEAYLEEFPNGKFASLARVKLKKLTQGNKIASGAHADSKPRPAPETTKAKLFVETDPTNARIRILNIKPKFYQGIELNPGSYYIEIAAGGYTMKKQWIKISAGEERHMSIALAKTLTTGSIHVAGSPHGANVYLDGNYKGKMPVLVKNVTPGSHKVRIQANDYIEKSESLTLDPLENKKLEINLRRIEKVVAREGRYEKYENGVVHDTSTGLEWYPGSNKNATWYQTKNWVESLSLAGGGWRMPAIEELGTLFQRDLGPRNITPLLEPIRWWVWSGQTSGSHKAALYNFAENDWYYTDCTDSSNNQSLAVRSRKK